MTSMDCSVCGIPLDEWESGRGMCNECCCEDCEKQLITQEEKEEGVCSSCWKAFGEKIQREEIEAFEKHDSVEAQYFYASVINTEEAYLSVEEYFPVGDTPENYHFVTLSHQRIADLHLKSENYSAAEAYYMELYYLAPEERHFRVYGIAGLANVYNRTANTARMADRLIELRDVLPLLNDDIQSEIMERLDSELREIVEQFQADATRQSTEGADPRSQTGEDQAGLTSALYRQITEFSKAFSELPSFQDASADFQFEVLKRFENLQKLLKEQELKGAEKTDETEKEIESNSDNAP